MHDGTEAQPDHGQLPQAWASEEGDATLWTSGGGYGLLWGRSDGLDGLAGRRNTIVPGR